MKSVEFFVSKCFENNMMESDSNLPIKYNFIKSLEEENSENPRKNPHANKKIKAINEIMNL